MARSKTDAAELDPASLDEALVEAKQELFNLRFRHATGALENNAALGRTRREIARLKTELRAREIEAAEALANEENA
jgi:large subunit ribosomal protein L29